ncbi:ABC transporter permease [Allorhizobium taibaishanense]|uniref:ABC transporter permease n=1 Tax=Allorhizobium taibaishanense TaxID=887144 RepID=A0A1Q9A6S1_9HYPH|nr:ABC transporter permease [Allorhizobium taibaishanense]MBB4008553.1 peptide/nickel transport system permease protein [Allorhizobium taibaishanense]OLP50296.1 ABC transporter permease [Allorhizobium taibaishanense]
MTSYILNRFAWAIPMLFLVSIAAFTVIQLPPGDYATALVAEMRANGDTPPEGTEERLRHQLGLDRPMYEQYGTWIGNIVLHGDFGTSLTYNQPVSNLIWSRLALTVAISFASLLLTWVIAIPIGVYAAARQYSFLDYFFTIFGFLGRGFPEFLSALILMWVAYSWMGMNVGGLFSPQMQDAPWSLAKVGDMFGHLWIPLLVLATSGAAGLIRVVRANMLDELNKPYVETALAQGLTEWAVIWRYPVRVALNPFISTIGWALPALISGDVITSVVLNLPTTGPLLLRALQSQDMYLSGSFILILGVFTILGTIVSDILLAISDPRIRYR